MRGWALIAVVALTAAVPLARAASESGIRQLPTGGFVAEISADGARVAIQVYNGRGCDGISVWSPLSADRRFVHCSNTCPTIADAISLGGTRLLWEDGISGNTYSGFDILTTDTRFRREPDDLYSYENTHDDQNGEYYGPQAGPFAAHGSLLVFETYMLQVSGASTDPKLWRVDGGHKRFIRGGLDFSSLSVDAGRIAGAVLHGPVLLLGRDGHTIRTFDPAVPGPRTVVLRGNRLAVVGGGRIAVFDTRSGRLETSRALPAKARFQDYAEGVAALVIGRSIQVFRVVDGRDRVVATLHARGLDLAATLAQLEPVGLYYAFSAENSNGGRVVFVPWKTVQQILH